MHPGHFSKDNAYLTLVLQVLGVEKPEGIQSLPVNLIINGHLPVQVCQLKGQWFLCGTIARELSQCDEEALPLLLDRASAVWGTLEGNFSYEQAEDSFFLWKNISEFSTHEELEAVVNVFLKELEFWRTEAAHAGCTGRDIFP